MTHVPGCPYAPPSDDTLVHPAVCSAVCARRWRTSQTARAFDAVMAGIACVGIWDIWDIWDEMVHLEVLRERVRHLVRLARIAPLNDSTPELTPW